MDESEKYYSNNISGFRQWCKDHKMPMFSNDILARKFHKKGNMYLEINKVKSFLSDKPFCGLSARQYNEEKHTFELINDDSNNTLVKTVFKTAIENFCYKYNIKEVY